MRRIWMMGVVLVLLASAHAEDGGVLGEWVTPTGATISIYQCNETVCAKLIALGRQAPVRLDVNNPDAALRSHPLCGLRIGNGFRMTDRNHTEGGQLYDPKSGKTYSGAMTSDGDSLRLRGYVGLKIFGRTEIWTRVRGSVPACTP